MSILRTPGWCGAALAVWLAVPACAQITESPQTVAPGRLLVEMDGLSLGFDRTRGDGTKYTAVGLANTILTAGLTDTVDLQVGATLFLRQKYDAGGRTDSRSGLGDTVFRAKWKFWSDEQLGAALAVIPYVKVPSSTGGVGSDAVEGGLIVPWAMALPAGVTAGAMARWDVVRNDADDGYDAQWRLTGYVERKLTSAFSVYGEGSLAADSTGLSDWAGTIGVGALLQMTKSVQFDYELQRGLNRRATDWMHVLRVNWSW